MRQQQQSYRLTIADQQPKLTPEEEKKRIRHVYLEEENIYGRFVPYLLLKDQLQSQVDSSGNTALHHMCSHNSPYLPLFLSSISNGDPILNKRSKLGHTPLDVAGLYCSKQHIELLKQKGAVDNGNVDYWAIQGANPSNWSGKIYPEKKALIHWAAYNDMPEVISEYAKQGVSVSEPDSNGYTPVDLTVLNKCYNSFKVLVDLGQRPKPNLLKSTDSKSIKQIFQKAEEKSSVKRAKKFFKLFSLFFLFFLCLLLDRSIQNMSLVVSALVIMAYIILKPAEAEKYMDNNRKTEFMSQLLLSTPINRNNHLSYLLLHILILVIGTLSIYRSKVTNHLIALCILIIAAYLVTYLIHFIIQVYGICKNTTYDEMFYSYRWPHLWEKIKYIQQRKLVIRQYSNGEDRCIIQNIKDYFIY